jgi:hydrogenase/urease accessory protein HupE
MIKSCLIAALWLLIIPCVAQAHLLPKQNATMHVVDKAAFFVVSVPVSALTGVDNDQDGALSLGEIQQHNREIQRQFEARFHVRSDGKTGDTKLTWVLSPIQDGTATKTDYVVVMHRVNFAELPENPVLETSLFGTRASERQMTITATRGDLKEVAILEAGTPSHKFFRGPVATFIDFVRVGIEHIWTGSDHLLFLLTILVAGAGWRHWVSVVTGFTVAHSITLVVSALGIFRIPASIVEPGIAASIVVMAMGNLWLWKTGQTKSSWIQVAVVFGCGLLHGFGFASAIGAMAVDNGSRLATLAGFNVGIEIGQFLFLGTILAAGAVLAMTKLSRFQTQLPLYASIVAAGLGSLLFIQRVI